MMQDWIGVDHQQTYRAFKFLYKMQLEINLNMLVISIVLLLLLMMMVNLLYSIRLPYIFQ